MKTKHILLLVFFLSTGTAFSDTIPGSRTFIPAWNSAGYPGAIPNLPAVNVKDYGAVGDGITDDTSAINDAINYVNAHAEVGMVYFPSGVYQVTSTLNLPANIILRGERSISGGNLAKLEFDLGAANARCINIIGSTAGDLQSFSPQVTHSTTIDVTDGSVFTIGDYAEIMQDNDPAWDNGDSWAAQSVGQIIEIVGISGNTLTLEHELRHDYESQFNPQIRKIQPKTGVGIDNLHLERLDNSTECCSNDTIAFYYAAESWVRGVELEMGVQRHINVRNSTKIEVTGCYIHHAHDYGGGGYGYGIECSFHTGESLIENNVFQHLRHSMIMQAGPNGNVFGYNYSFDSYRDEFPSDYASDIAFHGNRPFANLVEGNIVGNLHWDTSHGEPAGPFNTAFRNSVFDRWGLRFEGTCYDQNLAGNDTDNYVIKGSGHFQHGNREESGSGYNIVPSGTGSLPDYSYYLYTDPLTPVTPEFWIISASIPTIGPGSTLAFGSPNNPARDRYWNYTVKTVGPLDSVDVYGNIAPLSSITNPSEAEYFTAGDDVQIDVDAYDNDGNIVRVDFYSGTTWLGDDTTSPYSIIWDNVPEGSYSLTAKATDDDGAITTSTAVNITVDPSTNNPPSVSIISPTEGQEFTDGDDIVIQANASDSDGTVIEVEFFQGTTKLGEDTTSPYSYTWQNVPEGEYTLTAVAIDNGGAETTSDPVNISVNESGGIAIEILILALLMKMGLWSRKKLRSRQHN